MNATLSTADPREYTPHQPRSIPESYPYHHCFQHSYEPRDSCCTPPPIPRQFCPSFPYHCPSSTSASTSAAPSSSTTTTSAASTPASTTPSASRSISFHASLPIRPSMPHRESPVPSTPVTCCAMAAAVSSPAAAQWPNPVFSIPPTLSPKQQHDSEVAQALEIARESEDGATNPIIAKMLKEAMEEIWQKLEAQPDDYIMTKDEFAVFNYFQRKFVGNELARKARARFWGPSHPTYMPWMPVKEK